MAKMNSWDVYNYKGKWIDTVFYTTDCDAQYVLKSLIDHDGYDSGIQVSKDNGKTRFILP